jgi:hypothetical protein
LKLGQPAWNVFELATFTNRVAPADKISGG